MGIELGAVHKAAIKKQTNAWGGAALQLGAGDGFEFNSDTLKANAEMIMNNGITGAPFKRPGSAGPRKPNGDVSFDLYYKCSRGAGWPLASGPRPTPTPRRASTSRT